MLHIKDAERACPMCGYFLKMDETTIWCENPKCDFQKLFGELDKIPKKAPPRSKKEKTKAAMGVGFVEPDGKPLRKDNDHRVR